MAEVEKAIGMLYSLVIRFPDLDQMLRPVILELEKTKGKALIAPYIDGS